ncbi:MAG: response regulator [Candidatus Omnitrophica bacterium]|nr:response regulator [Candidatus Omnitrophota bacterium]
MPFNEKRVLIVEDEHEVAFLLGRHLDAFGYSTKIARNAEEALEEVSQFNPDVVLLDIYLPGKDGWSVLKDIRRHDSSSGGHSPRPVIVLSSRERFEPRINPDWSSISSFVAKPYSLDELLSAIDKALKGRNGFGPSPFSRQ